MTNLSKPGPTSALTPALAASLPIGLYFGAMFAVHGAAMPYLNLWLAHIGLSLGEIAAIAAVTPLVRMLVGPLTSLAADMTRAHRRILLACGWAWVATWILLSKSTTFQAALLAQILTAAASAGIGPLIEAVAVSSVRARGIDYGRVRVWGSISFIASSVLGGWLVDWQGIGAIIIYLAAGAAVTAMCGHVLPRFDSAVAPSRRVGLADALALVRAPEFLLFLLATGLVQSAHATLYVFSAIHWQSLGYSLGWTGALWAVSVAVEVAVFIWGSTHLRRFSPIALMMAGATAAVVRWTAMAFDPPPALLVPLQALHGLTYAATHLGAIQFLTRAVPETHGATAQGLYALVISGLFLALASAVAGLVYTRYGSMAYLPMALLSAGAIGALVALRQRWRGGLIGA